MNGITQFMRRDILEKLPGCAQSLAAASLGFSRPLIDH